jgi:septum formation protein
MPEIVVPNCDETAESGETPVRLVERLAALKAGCVAEQHREAWVLGGDTVVVLGGEILGKPADRAHAVEMLQRMQGTTHEVWGAFALVRRQSGEVLVASHRSRVTLVAMSTARIEAYVATGEPLDKAGSYALQGIGAAFVESVEGSHSNVVGLNLAAVLRALEERGVIELRGAGR